MSLESFALGFIAGEGSFYVNINHRQSGNVTFQPMFSLKVSEKEIVEKLAEDVGIGKTYSRPDTNGYVWKVVSIEDCLDFRDWIHEHGGEYWQTTHKSEQFEMWCEAVEAKHSGVIDHPEQKKYLVDLAFDIARSNTRKISKEEWYERIDSHYT